MNAIICYPTFLAMIYITHFGAKNGENLALLVAVIGILIIPTISKKRLFGSPKASLEQILHEGSHFLMARIFGLTATYNHGSDFTDVKFTNSTPKWLMSLICLAPLLVWLLALIFALLITVFFREYTWLPILLVPILTICGLPSNIRSQGGKNSDWPMAFANSNFVPMIIIFIGLSLCISWAWVYSQIRAANGV